MAKVETAERAGEEKAAAENTGEEKADAKKADAKKEHAKKPTPEKPAAKAGPAKKTPPKKASAKKAAAEKAKAKKQKKLELQALVIEPIKKQANSAEFLIKGRRHTFPNLLKAYLLKDPGVEFVSYLLRHPMDNDSVFVVRTKGKSVAAALESACKKIDKDLSSFEGLVKKAVK